jgi:hypothetical protein
MYGSTSLEHREVLSPPTADGAVGGVGKSKDVGQRCTGTGSRTVPYYLRKLPNKAVQTAAAAAEAAGRGLAKGNLREQNAPRTQRRAGAQGALEQVGLAAARARKMRFTALLHQALLHQALLHQVYKLETLRAWLCHYLSLKREAAAGVDGETWRHYGERLEDNLRALAERLKRGGYRAKPVRRGCTYPRLTGGNEGSG